MSDDFTCYEPPPIKHHRATIVSRWTRDVLACVGLCALIAALIFLQVAL